MQSVNHPYLKSKFKKDVHLVDTVILNILRLLPYCRSPPLKSADGWCNRVLENEMKDLRMPSIKI